MVRLAFLDIENIHVMRESLKKLQEHFARDHSPLNDALYESKWSTHVASLLRGAITLADSLNFGKPNLFSYIEQKSSFF